MKSPSVASIQLITVTWMLTVITVAKVNGLEDIGVQPTGPQPFSKKSPPPQAIPSTTEKDFLEESNLNALNADLSKYKNLHEESNKLNLTLTLLPSFNNDTSSILITPKNKTSRAIASPKTDLIKKPSGTLYVDSIHNLRDRPSPQGMSDCEVDDDFGNDDIHQLSASQFGFPKSIVSQALEESPFKPVLNLLIQLKNYMKGEQQDVDRVEETQNMETSKPFAPYSKFASATSKFKNYNNSPFMKDSPYTNNNKPYVPYPSRNEGSINGASYSSPKEFANRYNSFDRYNAKAEQFAPHLLEGSVFGSAAKPSEAMGKGDPEKNINYGFDHITNSNNFDNSNNNNNNNDFNTKGDKYNFGNYNFNYNKFDHENIEVDNQVDNDQHNRPNENKTTSTDAAPTSNTDGQTTYPPKTKTNLFSKFLPDVSSGNSWSLSTDKGINSYDGFNNELSKPYQRNNKLTGIMKSLFPPKKSESLPEISGLKDVIPKSNPIIQYSDKQKSNVESPFDLDIQSILGGITAGSSVGLGKRSSSDTKSSVSAAANKFGLSGGSKLPSYNHFNGGSPVLAGVTGDYNEIRFAQYRTRRKKREAGETCEASRNVLHQYQNHGGACFVVLPDVQDVQFATCPESSSCSDCGATRGDSRCLPVRVPLWVWSYCEEGPSGGTVAPDLVDIPVACVCKARSCRRRVPLGGS